MERAFKRTAAEWPTYLSDSQPAAWKAWLRLSATERSTAVERAADYAAACRAGKQRLCSFGVYLTERRWEKLWPVRPEAVPASIEARPFGPLWNAICLREILLNAPLPAPPPTSAFIRELLSRDDEMGRRERLRRQAEHGWPRVSGWYRQAEGRRGFATRAEDAWLATLMEPVPVNSTVMADWRAEYTCRGWPWLPDPGGMRVVYFPAGGPAGLDRFERALREAHHDVDGCEAAE
jgi:hypothetical protein